MAIGERACTSLWRHDRNGRFTAPSISATPPSGACGIDTLFSDDAVALIHQTSRSYPRAVNNLAIQALLAAFASNKAIVDESSARTAVTEVTTE